MPPPCYQMLRELCAVDNTIRSAISSCYPRSWNEDHITYTWLEKLRGATPKIFVPNSPRIRVLWDAYKMDGKLEEDNGDVAFLIKVTFPNQNTLSGVAFLEAKRIYDSGRYDALKWAQLKHMTDHSSHHHLLLYDFQEQEIQHPLTWGCCFGGPCFCDADENKAIGIVVPTFHALAYEEKSRSLTTIGYRLSEQIMLRYFRGLDLNFDQTLVENVIAGVAGGIKYLAVAHVILSKEIDAELSLQGVQPKESSGFRRLEDRDERRG